MVRVIHNDIHNMLSYIRLRGWCNDRTFGQEQAEVDNDRQTNNIFNMDCYFYSGFQ